MDARGAAGRLFFAAVVVHFDVTAGHRVGRTVVDPAFHSPAGGEDPAPPPPPQQPPPVKDQWALSAAEAVAVSRLALPDASSEHEGDVAYLVRLREGEVFLFGAVLFRQKRDPSQPRGYVQRSLVLLSMNPAAWGVLRECCKILGPLCFAYGEDVLERACLEYFDQVRNNVGLQADGRLVPDAISLAGTRILVSALSAPQILHRDVDAGDRHFLSDVPLFATFGGLCVALWQVWELVITGEPILVLGPNPERVSLAVLAIVSLAVPATAGIDFRPYLTIYDADFNTRFAKPQFARGAVLGTTNPFFLRSLEASFPNVISLGSSKGGMASAAPQAGASPSLWKKGTIKALLKDKLWERALFVTRDDALVAPDETVLRELRSSTQFSNTADPVQAMATNDKTLRQHFQDLTSAFLAPLDHFVKLRGLRPATSSPSSSNVSPSGSFTPYHEALASSGAAAPPLAFSPEAFLASLPRTSMRSMRFPKALYRRFINGPNFKPWLDRVTREHAEQRLSIHRHLIIHTDADALVRTVSASPAPDAPKKLMAKVSGTLEREQAKPQPDSELLAKIGEHLTALRKSLTV